jgi:hypothetical protein
MLAVYRRGVYLACSHKAPTLIDLAQFPEVLAFTLRFPYAHVLSLMKAGLAACRIKSDSFQASHANLR